MKVGTDALKLENSLGLEKSASRFKKYISDD